MSLRTKLLAATALSILPLTAFAGELAFSPIPWAADDAAKREAVSSPSAIVDGVEVPLAFHVLARSGDKIGDGVWGALTDRTGAVVKSEDGSEAISVDTDFTSLITVGDKLYSISHFESRPGAMYLTELSQDADGNLTAVSTKPVDFSAFGGLWVPCAGSVTPWGTHFGSEEYPADARAIEAATTLEEVDSYNYPMVRYEGLDPATMTLDAFRAAFNTYRYGYPTEVTVAADGTATAAKRFALGRVAVELPYVMPDEKTVYVSDDGTNVGLFKFVADKAGDLTAGSLYALKWTQTSDAGAGAADVSWIDLGHAVESDIQKAIESGVKFFDIFETADMAEDGTCPADFLASIGEDRHECLKVKPGMETVASRVETRRYASMMGATIEFRKMEGITYNPDHGSIYLAMSEVAKGMEAASKNDIGGPDDIRVAKNACGAVYELKLDDSFSAISAVPVVEGIPAEYADGTPEAGNTCDLDGISNPDNVTYLPGYNTLIIGEDTGSGHQNDVIWAFNTETGTMDRIFSTPYGSETTSPYWYSDVNGHGYLMAVIQHPYGESDEDKLADPADARAYAGYIGPFPALTK
ncbi:MAG: DUF839 domain-containing protein [Alphaproteobacteria bacterium]|nr:DUF839 domain-containing protein [Alphaproteobacteria bacterium]